MSSKGLRPLELTPPREQVLAFIKAEVAAGRPFPSEAAIVEHTGWTVTYSRDVLNALWVMGHLRLAGRAEKGRKVWALNEGAAA